MIGKPSLLLEYVLYALTGSFSPRGAGVSAGGIRVIGACLIGIQPVADETLTVFNGCVGSGGCGGRIDFLINTIFGFGVFC